MAKRGKNYKKVAAEIETTKAYSLEEGVELALKGSFTKFDESVDVSINLGIDPTKGDQTVRGSVLLPYGRGKQVKILVFAKGDHFDEAKEAGADYVGGQELVDKICWANQGYP